MKNITCVLLSVILCSGLLSACSKENTQETNATSAATSTETTTEKKTVTTAKATTEAATEPETTTQEDPYLIERQENLATANQFLNYIKNKDIKNIVKLIGAEGYGKEQQAKALKAYSFFRDVDVHSFKILDEHENDYGMQYKVLLNISKSSNALFSVGTSRWILDVDNSYDNPIRLFKHANKTITEISHLNQSDIVEFCYSFSLELGCYKTVSDFNDIVPDTKNKGLFNRFCEGLIRLLDVPYTFEDSVDRQDLERKAKSALGITGVDFKKDTGYNKAHDTIFNSFLGGHYNTCSLSSESFDPITKQYTVVIDYYSDTAYILKAKTVKYIARENKDESVNLLSTELLYDIGVQLYEYMD